MSRTNFSVSSKCLPQRAQFFAMENTYTRAWQLQKLIRYRNITTIQRKYWQKNQHATETLPTIQSSLGPGLAVGGKGKKTGSNRKNIGEWSERRGILGGWAVEPGVMPLMPPFNDTRFWYLALIGQMSSCWHIRGAVWQYRALSIWRSYNSGKDFLKHGFRASNTNFYSRPFTYPSAPRRAKNMPVICCKKKKKYSRYGNFLTLSCDKLRSPL